MVKFKVEDANFNKIYPVGSIYMSINETNPSELFGGEWEQIEDKFLLACGTKHPNGEESGEEKHTLTINEMPQHTHSPPTWVHYTSSNGNTGSYNVTRATGGNGNTYVGSTPQTNKDVGYTGGGQSHNNMPPYLAVYCWVRIA